MAWAAPAPAAASPNPHRQTRPGMPSPSSSASAAVGTRMSMPSSYQEGVPCTTYCTMYIVMAERETLTQERIVAAALAVADSEDLPALTMRRLARELGA